MIQRANREHRERCIIAVRQFSCDCVDGAIAAGGHDDRRTAFKRTTHGADDLVPLDAMYLRLATVCGERLKNGLFIKVLAGARTAVDDDRNGPALECLGHGRRSCGIARVERVQLTCATSSMVRNWILTTENVGTC